MKVFHICLSSFFIDGRLYQENELVLQHVADGHEVTVITSTETHAADGKIVYTEPGTYVGHERAQVIRLPYRRNLPHRIARKLRMHPGLRGLLERASPDAIIFHGCAGWELMTVARYVRNHQDCRFYIDSHTDAYNSARGWVSRNILHRQFYRRVLQCALPVAGPLLCVSTEVMDFAAEIYQVPSSRLELFPLGGRPPSDDEYAHLRQVGRARLGLSDGQILLVQSGKQSRSKKLLESLQAFAQTDGPNLRLAIAGVLQEDILKEAEALIAADPRVVFLGWQGSAELTELLCAADVYLQPGTQSATMQQSLCCRCSVILADFPAHRIYKVDNGWFVSDEAGLKSALSEIVSADLVKMGKNSHRFASERLDYAVLAQRVLI